VAQNQMGLEETGEKGESRSKKSHLVVELVAFEREKIDRKTRHEHPPGNVECTPISKLVSSTGNLSRSSLSVKVTGFLKYMEAITSRRWMSQKMRRTASRSRDASTNSSEGTGVSVGCSGLWTPRPSTI
jgi:hypothetical protein